MESLFLKIKLHRKVICVGEMYRVPNTTLSEFEDSYMALFTQLRTCKDIIIGSYHNLDFCKVDSHRPTGKFVQCLSLHEFVSCITKPTRVTHTSCTLIDNIFCKGSFVFNYKSYVLVDDLSDHYPCILQIDLPMSKPNYDKVIMKRKWKKDTIPRLNQYLLFHDWSNMNNMTVDELYEYLVMIITKYLDELTLKVTMLLTNKEVFREPWMNIKLCKMNKKCKKLFKKVRISGSIVDLNRYKCYRQALNRLKLHEKRVFYDALFKKIGKDSKTPWSVLNSLIKHTNNKKDIISLLEDGRKINDQKEVCNVVGCEYTKKNKEG